MGFHSDVILDYKAEIDAELAAAEEEYQQALAEYPEKEAAAKAAHDELVANYERDLEEWNSKGSLGKIIEKKVLRILNLNRRDLIILQQNQSKEKLPTKSYLMKVNWQAPTAELKV